MKGGRGYNDCEDFATIDVSALELNLYIQKKYGNSSF